MEREEREAFFHTALVCLNGHILEDRIDTHPEMESAHCPRCGESTITTCPNCETPIRGDYEIEGVAGLINEEPPPKYCHACANPYPWTNRTMNDEGEEDSGEEQLEASRPRYTHPPANPSAAMATFADSVKTAGGIGESVAKIMPAFPQYQETQSSMESKARIVAGSDKTVFVIYGRNLKAKDAMMNYLEALGVAPKELSTVPFDKGSPTIEDLLESAFKIAKGVIVLLTPDDRSHLRGDWANPRDRSKNFHKPMYQPRMNVVFEIGVAWGKGKQDNTILVEMNEPIEGEELRMPSDVSPNRLAVAMYDSGSIAAGLPDLKKRLETVLGCSLDEIDEEQRSSFEEAFLRAITEVKEPVGIAGLDKDRWVARTVSGVSQGVDFRRVNLGSPFGKLTVAVTSKSPYWRAGIKLEESDSPTTVPALVHEKGLLFHLFTHDNSYWVRGYYDLTMEDLRTKKKKLFVDHRLAKVDVTPIHIELAVRERGGENLLFCKVVEEDDEWQPVPPVRIPDKLDLLSNVYLVAWGDSETTDGEEVLRDYEVEFSDLKYELWKE